MRDRAVKRSSRGERVPTRRRRSSSKKPQPQIPKTVTHIRVVVMIVMLVTLVAAELARRVRAPGVGMSTDLLGQWTTTDQRYGDRAFRFTHDSLTLDLGDGGVPLTYPIGRVTRHRIEGATSYVVEYDDPTNDVSYKLPFVYKDGGIIHIANQDGVEWTKGGTAMVRSRPPSGAAAVDSTLSPLSQALVLCIKDATARGQATGAVRCVVPDST
jgi:hypothetical protein